MELKLPKAWQSPGSWIVALATVIGTTIASLAWAGSQVQKVADNQAQAVAAPIRKDLDTHVALEQQRHEYEDQHIASIEQKLDALLELTPRRSKR